MNEAWIKFLLEHPTRGGLAERLTFEAGWRAGVESVGVPQDHRKDMPGRANALSWRREWLGE